MSITLKFLIAITPEDDIWEQRGDYVLDGANFSAIDNGWGGVWRLGI